MKHTYTVEQDPSNNSFTLVKDGTQCFCPKIAPILIPGSLGTVSMSRMSCNTCCPFANIYDTGAETIYKITCESASPLTDYPIKLPEYTTGIADKILSICK